jgi:uncharacterized protein
MRRDRGGDGVHARKSVAVIGSGISGLGAAWLLSKHHDVTLIEASSRAGGHSCTVEAPGRNGPVAVDTGFIVYNPPSYPNLVALFEHLRVPTAPSKMSFAVSMNGGGFEYAGSSIASLIGQPANALNPKHWRMILDIFRFFRAAPYDMDREEHRAFTLGAYLRSAGYSEAFISRHILPMAAAIWSTPSRDVLDFPLASFVRFFANHGLLQARNRPQWRTVAGGSREYVRRMLASMSANIRLGEGALRISRQPSGVTVETTAGRHAFDHCVVACHADQALALLGDPDPEEHRLLGAFRYQTNRAVLHTDINLMPQRRRLWSSWNYLGGTEGIDDTLSLTYWMNNLQPLPPWSRDLFVTINPAKKLASGAVVADLAYAHPMFDTAAIAAQRDLWSLQGRRRTWFCGSYFGFGFHEDGLQSGLAVAEEIGGVRRPWCVANESGRIRIAPVPAAEHRAALEEVL